jgi:hypothetical protein
MAGANAGHFIAASTGWRQAEPVANSQIWRPAARFFANAEAGDAETGENARRAP